MKIKGKILNILKIIGILILTVITSFALQELHFKEGNILLIYLLGVIIIIVETSSFLWGFFSSLFFVAAFNFLFTDPKLTLMINDKNYVVSLIIFIVVAIIANTLTTRLQRQMIIAQKNEEITKKLFKISTGFLNLSSPEQIVLYGEKSLSQILCLNVKICLENEFFEDKALEWCFNNATICGVGKSNFYDSKNLYIPLKSKRTVYGVSIINCCGNSLSNSDSQLVNTVNSQVIMALERAYLNISEEKNKISIEKEKLKSNLLRSISHDLRTPLTGIAGGADFLRSNYNDINKEEAFSVLDDIISDATWLSGLVENLLNMTRIQDRRLILSYSNEVVDDIIGEVVIKVSKRCGKHQLTTKKPEEVLLVPMDGQLIIQVLINLIDNAFKHTEVNSTVLLSSSKHENTPIFEVIDNGGGIDEEKLPHIFDSFYTSQACNSDKQRGMGLGLSICKSIVEAHNGKITAENNEMGGGTFKVILPLEVENYE